MLTPTPGATSKRLSAPPLRATPRNPAARTDGPLVAAVAEALGTPLLPWQRLVADVAGERTPTGAYAYPIVVVTVPRQSGKTTLMRARGVARCLSKPNAQVFMTAQTGKDARERWEDLVKQIMAGPLRAKVKAKRTAGAVRLDFPNGSAYRVFAPVAASLHGYTPLEVHLDEAWAFDAVRGESLLGAIVPAQITVFDRQLWIVSTAGTAESTFLRGWVDAGRAGAPGVALFEWACPDGADPYDPAVVAAFHPAVGFTQSVDDIIGAAAAHSRSEYERAYANRWTVANDAIVSADVWAGLAVDQIPPVDGPVIGYDVAHDRTSTAVVAAWLDPAGLLQLRTVRHDAGADWAAAELPGLARTVNAAELVADSAGPVRTVTAAVDPHAMAGRPHRTLTAAEYASACGELLAEIRAGRVRHDGSAPLADAVAAAVTRPLGDLWCWSRSKSRGPIPALVAATVAGYVARHPAPPESRPFIVTDTPAETGTRQRPRRPR